MVYVVTAVLWTLLCAMGILLTAWSQEIPLRIQRAWARGWCKLLDTRIEIFNPENIPTSQAVVFAPNHSSMFDIVVLAALPIRFRWISKREVGKIPFVGWAMRAVGAYFVTRDRSVNDLSVMKKVEQGLRDGHSVVIFPEGTRTRTGELLAFKKGAFRTAQNAGVPLCPIAISGTREIARPGKWPTKRGQTVSVNFGTLFRLLPTEEIAPAMARFRQQLVALLEVSAKVAR